MKVSEVDVEALMGFGAAEARKIDNSDRIAEKALDAFLAE